MSHLNTSSFRNNMYSFISNNIHYESKDNNEGTDLYMQSNLETIWNDKLLRKCY